jgi:hypothetical protein
VPFGGKASKWHRSVTSVTQTTASSGGTVVSNGGATVTVSGIAWSTTANPTTANTKTTDGWAIGGPWADSMTGLIPNTTYHVRAYATNSVGTAYGADVTFTTATATCTLPWGGSIASGSSATAYQAASVISPLACTSQSRTCTNGVLSGTYTNQSCSVIPAPCTLPWGGLIASGNSTTAYQASSVTAPATCTSQSRTCTNGTLSGTYANQGCVVNPATAIPTVTTRSVTSVTQTTASSGGTVVSNGGATVTVSGIAWSTTANPTTANTKTTDGWAIGGPWADSMTGLIPNTTYHVRAYATNSVGTAYGADVTFTTATATCTLPWGGSIASGSSATAYQAASVISPLACTSQSRTCTNGVLSGTYTNQSCSVIPAPCTLPWGGLIASGNSTTAYQASSVTAPATCTSQSRTCTNGTLSGTYTNQSCVVNPASACGDGICNAPENPLTCPQDCKVKYQQF